MATITTATPASTASVATDALLGLYKRAPIELVRGDGVELFDSEDRAYLDFTSGIAVNALGYGDAGLRDAIHAAADGLIHVSNLFRTAPGEQLAARLVELSFAHKVFFCNSGAEANEGAFKFARKWARTTVGAAKTDIISLRGAFHGRLFASLAATDRPSYRAPFRPLAGGCRSSSGTSKTSRSCSTPRPLRRSFSSPYRERAGSAYWITVSFAKCAHSRASGMLRSSSTRSSVGWVERVRCSPTSRQASSPTC